MTLLCICNFNNWFHEMISDFYRLNKYFVKSFLTYFWSSAKASKSAVCLQSLTYLNHDNWGWNCATGVEIKWQISVSLDFFCQTTGNHFGKSLFLGLSLSSQFGTTMTKSGNVVLKKITSNQPKLISTSHSHCAPETFKMWS